MAAAVTPRPIAFASTTDQEGNVNLSPFSFFNLFSAAPPILVFSPLRRMRNNSTKHTLQNVLATKEVVIHIANYSIVEQMSLASTEYDAGTNEFTKSGLTQTPSVLVAPPRVQEAPVAFECRVQDVIPLGTAGGAGNLVVCEVLLMHLDENILDDQGNIDPFKLDAVARMGGDYYIRASGDALFKLPKPVRNKGIGVDQLPAFISANTLLTGNHLARLGNTETLPSAEDVVALRQHPLVAYTLNKYKDDSARLRLELQKLGIKLLEDNQVTQAWKVLLLSEQV